MTKAEFLKRFHSDYNFRMVCRMRGIRVIQNNVIFFNPDGTVRFIAGNHIK